MRDQAEIDKAVGAHGMWKSRLKQAINTGKTDMPAETIRLDNQCAFGKWLYGPTFTSMDKTSDHYNTVRELHAEFHRTAAQVAGLAVAGNKSDAEKMLSLDGDYALISGKLTKAMMDWKKSIG